jgi:hypothetical protein
VTIASTDVVYATLVQTGPMVTIQDGVAPAATLGSIADLELDGSAKLTWSAGNSAGGPFTYVVQSRTAPASGGVLSNWRTIFGPSKFTSRTVAMPTQGSQYCFRVIATNAAGLVSAPSVERCTATPVDDRVWGRTRSWTRAARAGAYRATVTRSVTRGSFLDLGITGTRAAIVATKCPTCGTMRVRFNGTLIGTFNLKAPRTQVAQVLRLPSFKEVKKGKLRVEVVGAGKPVEIDGVLVWRQ